MYYFRNARSAPMFGRTVFHSLVAIFAGLFVIVAVLFQNGGRTVKADTPPGGGEQHLVSPGDVPDGLAPSEWQSIRDAHNAWRQALSPAAISQQAYLKPAAVGTAQGSDNFGISVAVSGDTVVVGADFEDSSTLGVNTTPDETSGNSGAAYVFTRSGTTWTQQAYLKPAAVGTTQAGDQFGISVAVSGDTVIVGANLEDSGTTGVNTTPDESSSASGAAYVFTRTAGVWTQQAYLKPAAVGTTQAGDSFGRSVDVSGDTVVVGANQEDSSTLGVNSTPDDTGGPNPGAAYVFIRSAGVWTQQAYLKPAAVGTTQAGDFFGMSVAVSGDTVVVGANGEDSSTLGVQAGAGTPDESATDSGAAYVFTRSGTTWTQQAYLKPAAVGTTQAGDGFGRSVAVSADTVVVGAPGEDSSSTGVNTTPDETSSISGAAYVFSRTAGVWTQQAYLKPAAVGTTQATDQFGVSVAVWGGTVVVGANFEDSSTTGTGTTPNEIAADSGAAYVFTRSGATWTQQTYLKPAAVGTTQAGDDFGVSVAVSGGTVVVGANLEDSSTLGVNSTPNEASPPANSGAAYTFAGLGPTAASVSVSGRVMTPDGRGLRNATVVLIDEKGNAQRVRTGSLGSYTFAGVSVGQTYVMAVESNTYRYSPRMISLDNAMSGLDFVPVANARGKAPTQSAPSVLKPSTTRH